MYVWESFERTTDDRDLLQRSFCTDNSSIGKCRMVFLNSSLDQSGSAGRIGKTADLITKETGLACAQKEAPTLSEPELQKGGG